MNEQVKALQAEVMDAKQRLRDAVAAYEPEPVEDWELRGLNGCVVNLSRLFGDKSELLLIHNMGRGCSYCSLWADGLIGVAPHLMQRCAMVLCSNDPPEVVRAFREVRGWDFPCVSGRDTGFAHAMGYGDDEGKTYPGVSAFHKRGDGTIIRTGHMPFGPGDDFCAVWPMLDLIKDGKSDWEPAPGAVSPMASVSASGGCQCI
jgi:predicted dithiol-disulfide oxidoreductase (DUF899 family)